MMIRFSRLKKLLPLLWAVIFFLSAQPGLADFSPDNAVKIDPLASQKQSQGLSVGEFTGTAIYEYPISLPPGRNGMTPSLKLTYSSQDGALDNLVGYRWSLSQYSIKRINKRGVEKLYSRNDFMANLPFESGELTEVSLSNGKHGIYTQRFESSFAKYEFLPDDTWLVTDKQGNEYYFAENNGNAEWMLTQVRDPNDNFIRFTYEKIDNRLYPDEIFYTGHGSQEGIFRVKFLRSAGKRPDAHFSYATGFRVDTNHLIEGIEVYVHDELRQKIGIHHSAISPLVRQTISSITHTGYDENGSPTSLPPTTFDYTKSAVSWQETSDYQPEWFFESCHSGNATCEAPKVYYWDMTGDGLVDFEYTLDNTNFIRAINNGQGGWTQAPATHFTSFYSPRIPSLDYKALDFNGDLNPEIVSNLTHQLDVELAAGQNPGKRDNGAALTDLNGDGLVDIIQKRSWFTGSGPNDIQSSQCLNHDGTACLSTNLWESPEVIISDTDFYQYPRQVYVQDCNYDGLADVRYAGSGSRDWINDGQGSFILNPPGTCHFSQLDSLTRRSADVNGDGLIDSIISEKTITPGGQLITNEIHLNRGDGQTVSPIKNAFPMVLGTFGNTFGSDDGVRMIDLNGDRLPDIMQSKRVYDGNGNTTITKKVYINRGIRPYFLRTVHTATGSQINLEYGIDGPLRTDTVRRMTVDDGMGNISETNYSYEDGHYYFENSYDKAPAGFRVVTKTDGQGYQTKSYYHQSQHSVEDGANGEYQDHISKKGRAYRSEVYEKNGQLIAATINRFEHKQLGDDRFFAYLAQTLSQSFDGGQPKATAKAFSYDNLGNRIEVIDFGEVIASGQSGSFSDTGSDLLKTLNSYISQTGFAFENKMFDQNSALLTHSKTYYDNLGLGQVDKGNVTAQEVWLDSPNTWLRSETEYNQFGLPTVSTNPRGFSNATHYDADQLYPATVSNAKGHTSSMAYDPAIGQLLSSTDPNGSITITNFDGLGRAIRLEKDGQLMSTTTYNDLSQPRSVHSVAYNDDGQKVDAYTYLDALDRVIQSKQEAPKGQWITTQNIYDERGHVKKQIQPYFSSSANFEALNPGKIGNSFTYDALGRVLSATNPLGATTSSHKGWEVTSTDLNGNPKTLAMDARGNLIRVDEKNAGQTYQTHYTYDSLGRLLQIRDAKNNVRSFAYDSLGRRLFQSKLASGAGWSYSYDLNGNLISKTDPKGQVISYSYDELDRLLTENDLSYTYDQGENAIGHLSKVHRPNYEHSFTYDSWGRLLGDQKKIGEKSFEMAYGYDRLGAITSMTYPDGTLSTNHYDSAHQLEEARVGSEVFVNQFEYVPTGQVAQMTLGNGVIVANTYDPNQLYRLTSKAASNNLQSYQYSYDPVGNLVNMIDGNGGITAKTVSYSYDDLHRLTQAAYTGTANETDLTQSYEYDPLGNMTFKSDVGQMAYTGSHPHAVTAAGPHAYDYDANGNMTQHDTGQLIYDKWDRLIESSGKATFSYGEGYDRLTKTDLLTGTATYYPNQYFELHPEKEVKYIYAGGLRIAKIEKELAYTPPSPDPDPDPQPGPNPNPQPDPQPNPTPSIPTPTVSSQGTGGGTGGGSYGSQDELKLMRLISEGKKEEARQLSNKIYLYTLNSLEKEKEETLVAGNLPESGFENLRITYNRNSALMAWDAMPSEVVSFKIYRSKGNRASALDDAEVLIADLKASPRKNRFLHQLENPGSHYAYQIEAFDKKGKSLLKSFRLHANQIFVYEDQQKIVDFRNFSRADFSHVRIKSNEYVDGKETSIPQRLLLKPDAALENGARLSVNFLNCENKEDGSNYCKKADSQFVELYVLNRNKAVKKTVAFLKDSVSRLSAALLPTAFAEEGDTSTYYLLTDHLGSIDQVLDDQGNVVERRDFLPYGSERLSEPTPASTKTDHKFTGKELDSETGLYYYGARYYDPLIGRFIALDPWEGDLANPQTLNKYTYVLNNPLKFVDPTGMYNMTTGEVEKGDTLGSITGELNEYFGTNYSYGQVAQINNISNPDRLEVGQSVKMGTINVDGSVWHRSYDADKVTVGYWNNLNYSQKKITHYGRNLFQGDLPATIDALILSEWSLMGETSTHNLAGASRNLDFRGRGNREGEQLIINRLSERRVDGAENMGTYDFVAPGRSLSSIDKHLTIDVQPWIEWGNSPQDTTTKSQRIEAMGSSMTGSLGLMRLGY